MIGSTIGQMAAADKLSVGQLQQAIKDGTVPAYIGIPMLQQKVKDQQQAQALAAQQAQAQAQKHMAEIPSIGAQLGKVRAETMAKVADAHKTDEEAKELCLTITKNIYDSLNKLKIEDYSIIHACLAPEV